MRLKSSTSILQLLSSLLCVLLALGLTDLRAQGGNPESEAFSGKVSETMNAASYTYVLVDTGKKKLWAAAPQFAVKVGDTVAVANAMPMTKYHSKTLNRNFDLIYFTGSVTVNGKAPGAGVGELPPGHPSLQDLQKGSANSAKKAASPTDFSGIKPPAGGKTVADIVTGKDKLRGKEVAVRAKVVKYNSMIMGKNWLHIRDGSGSEGSNDLTVTTSTPAKVGDTVLVKAKVSTNRDFGGGYKYPVILEDANVTVE